MNYSPERPLPGWTKNRYLVVLPIADRGATKWILVALLFAGGYLLVSAGGWLMSSLQPANELPSGWSSIDPPHEVHAMIIDGNHVWTGGKDGVYQVDMASLQFVKRLELPGEADYIRVLHGDASGRL